MLFRPCCLLATAQRLNALPASTYAFATSADIIRKWQHFLSDVNYQRGSTAARVQHISNDPLRQLLKDAIQVYTREGAADMLPDQITDVLIRIYSKIQAPDKKLTFFTLLANEFGVQRGAVDAAVRIWQDTMQLRGEGASPELMYRLADKLVAAGQPLYMQLLLPISQHKVGIAFLVGLRGDLLQLLKDQPASPHGAALRALGRDLRSALARWYTVGLLQLQRITWEQTPGQLLERIVATEAVHKMKHMEELKTRLQQSNRRVFVFLHPSLPCEPLVVLHTAIMEDIPSSMAQVLQDGADLQGTAASTVNGVSDAGVLQQQRQEEQQPGQQMSCQQAASAQNSSNNCIGNGTATGARCTSNTAGAMQQLSGTSCSICATPTPQPGSVACFYSISSSQPGLSGVDLGNFLIKKAAQLLLSELPQLQHLVTLSPIPGFRAWLMSKLQQDAAAAAAVTTAEQGSSEISLPPAEAGSSSADGDTSSCSSSDSSSGSSTGSGSEVSGASYAWLLRQDEAATVDAAMSRLQHSAQHNTAHNSAHYTAACGKARSTAEFAAPPGAAASQLLNLVQQHAWLQLPDLYQSAVQQVLLRLCAVYLLTQKRRSFALDPVAHFHLKNGAWLWRINCRADLSAAGLDHSCGLMVNYRYVLADVTANNQAYLVDHEIAASEAVRQLL